MSDTGRGAGRAVAMAVCGILVGAGLFVGASAAAAALAPLLGISTSGPSTSYSALLVGLLVVRSLALTWLGLRTKSAGGRGFAAGTILWSALDIAFVLFVSTNRFGVIF